MGAGIIMPHSAAHRLVIFTLDSATENNRSKRKYSDSVISLAEVRNVSGSTLLSETSCRRAAATICPRPGLQRKRAVAALSQAGRAGPDQPIRAMQPAGRTRRPPTGCMRQTSDRQTSDRIIA